MPLQILNLGKQFRPQTSIKYPPFKNGRYMEEYFYDYALAHKDEFIAASAINDRVYIPVFWTNLQTHPGFSSQKRNYEFLLSLEMAKMPPGTRYFTVVQHDDGIQLKMVGDIIVFGACTGTIPLPLIYEDTSHKLINCRNPAINKRYLCSFIGSITHDIRIKIRNQLLDKSDTFLGIQGQWTANVPINLSELFIEKTLESKFCLAPRGYGRSSFRFFEAIQLGIIPVYFWDDMEWLPYKDVIDYSKFSVSIQEKDIANLYTILKSISHEKYASMVEELDKARPYFTLEFMCEYCITPLDI